MLDGLKCVWRWMQLYRLLVIGSCLQCAIGAESRADETPQVPAPVSTASVIAAAQATAEGPVQLAYKFESGQFVYYSGSTRLQYVHQLEDRDQLARSGNYGSAANGVTVFQTSQNNEIIRHFRVVTVDEKGNSLIEPVIDQAKMTAQLPDKPQVVYDSRVGGLAPAQFRSIQESIGRAKARFQVAPNGELLKAIIVDDSAPAALRDAAEKLTTRFEFLIRLPVAPVKIGESWRENYTTIAAGKNGVKQPIDIRRIYKLASISDGIAIIKFKTILLTSLNDPELEKQVSQQTPQGTIEFDIEAGRVRSYVSTVNQTTVNAFGSNTVLQVIGESTEKLISPEEARTASTK